MAERKTLIGKKIQVCLFQIYLLVWWMMDTRQKLLPFLKESKDANKKENLRHDIPRPWRIF